METNLSNVPLAGIEHHGVKGMRWGVRKRPDSSSGGATNQSGSKHFLNTGNGSGNSSSQSGSKYFLRPEKGTGQKDRESTTGMGVRVAKQTTNDGSRHAFVDIRPQKKRSTDRLTNEELSATIERMRLEQEYARLADMDLTKGQKLRRKITNAAVEVGTDVAKGMLKDYIKSNFGGLQKLGDKAKSDVNKTQTKAAKPQQTPTPKPQQTPTPKPQQTPTPKPFSGERLKPRSNPGSSSGLDQDYTNFIKNRGEPSNANNILKKYGLK